MPTFRTGHYLDYWGFDRSPFALTPDPDMLYLSKQHRECMLRLQYAIASNKGGALLVSENPGDGKTSVLRRLEKDLRGATEERYRVVFIDHPTLTPNQVLWEILRQLGFGESRGEKIQNLLQLREALQEMYERGERCILILDEGQLLADRPELLQEFRVLLNYTVGETFLLTFLFSGQSELENVMKRYPELYQRLPVRFFLHSMDLVDTGRMLEHRVRVAGYEGPRLFAEDAVREIFRYSKGIPRVICTVADLALVVGHSRGARQISSHEVFMAIRDLDRSTQDGYHYYHFLRSAGAPTPEEEREISEAEAKLDHQAVDEALERLEAEEKLETAFDVERLAAQIEEWKPPAVPLPPGEEAGEGTGTQPVPVEPAPAEPAPPLPEARRAGSEVKPEEDTPADTSEEPEELFEETSEEPEGVLETGLEEAEEEAEEAPVEPEETVVDPWFQPFPGGPEAWVHCPVCGNRQPANRTTCAQCAAPLHWVCPSCEHRNPAQHERCDRCGQSLAQAVGAAEEDLREAVANSPAAAEWGFRTTPETSLKLGEGERVLAVVVPRKTFGRGVAVRARLRAWGGREQRLALVVTNHRLHLSGRDRQSRVPFHEIQGLRATRGRLLLFHGEGSVRIEYPTSETRVYELVHALIAFLEFQVRRFKV
jgi:general secretion pathway protein A